MPTSTSYFSQPAPQANAITAIDAAVYLVQEYNRRFNEHIDELKLHKLLYFSQRESFLLQGEPMFSDTFEAWMHGPVILSVRKQYKTGELFDYELPNLDEVSLQIFDEVLSTYGHISSWDLSNITHREISWRNAREGIPEGVNGNNPMLLEDIRKDANRRSCLLAQRGIAMLRKGEFDVRDFYK